jgi:hypothetical protein
MKKLYAFAIVALLLFCNKAVAQPPNDDCSNATTITLSNNTGFVVAVNGTLTATASSQTSGDGTGKDDDVWYQFTTPASSLNGQVVLSDYTYDVGYGNPVIELWTACSNSSFDSWYPFATTANLGALAASTTYRVRVYTYGTSSRFNTFKITVNLTVAPPANDTYSSAQALTFSSSASCTNVISGTTVGATTESPAACTGASTTAPKDVWYSFTASSSTMLLQLTNITLVAGTSNTMWLQVLEGSNTGTLKACSNTGSINFNGSTGSLTLTVGTTYFIRVYNNDDASSCTFAICGQLPAGQPNDDCTYATTVPVSSSAITCTTIPITTVNALPSANPPTCLSTNYRDVWLKFTPTSTGLLKLNILNYTAISGSTNPLYSIAIYNGSSGCANLSFINCISSTITSEIALGSFTSGTTYYLRLMCATSVQGNFDVCIKQNYTIANTTVAADSTCVRAIPIISSINNTAAYTNGTTNGIRVVSQFACYGSYAPNALAWYSFTVPANGIYLVDVADFVRLDANANGAGYRILKRTSCYTTGTDTIITRPPETTYDTVLCVDNIVNNNQTVNLTTGTQYYLTMMENSYNGGRIAYKLRVVGTLPPNNDDSTNSTTLVQEVTCNGGTATTTRFSSLSSVPNPYALSNNGTYTQDVWYRFIAATTSVNIATNRVGASTRLAVYNSNGSIKYDPAANSNSITVNSLTVGSMYLIRVLNTAAATVNSQADFTICVFGAPSTTLAGTVGACTSGDATKLSTGSGNWLHFTKAGQLMLSVFDGPATTGATFNPRGNITASYFTNAGGIRLNAGTAILDRNFEISDGGNNFSNSPVKIRLYFTIAEFNTLVTSGGGITAINELRVYRIPGASCNSTTTAGGLYYNIVGTGYLSDPLTPYTPTAYYIDMITPNFSGFFLQKAADNLLIPSTCNVFTYKIAEQKVQLQFSTKTEINTNYFEIERSADGTNFSTISTITATNNSNGNSYQFTDATIKINTIYYYRLKQVDKDGSTHFVCSTIKVNTGSKRQLFSNAYPNPVNNLLSIDVLKPLIGNVDVQIINAVGQVLQQYNFNLQSFDTQLRLNTTKLNTGIYTLRITTNDAVQVQQVIKL